MQEFNFKQNIDESYMVNRYSGDEDIVAVPSAYYGHPVTMLYDGLFYRHHEIKEVHLPDTITCIGSHVFDGCDQLTSLTLPEALTDLMQYSFTRSGIKSLLIPDGVTRIVPFACYQCEDLETVYLGRYVKRIDAYAFSECHSLKQVYMPYGVIVNRTAFDECPYIDFQYYK